MAKANQTHTVSAGEAENERRGSMPALYQHHTATQAQAMS
jgi:hypothetical protein